jgi:hypothetical protein
MIHCWHLFPGTPESEQGIAEIAEFIGLHWSGAGAVTDAGADRDAPDHG